MSLRRTSLREQVRDWILQRIGTGEFAPGERIMEEKVATELNVSPIPVREAIRELVVMGVLTSAAHKGAWVREVEVSETIEALQVRAAIESLAIKLGGPLLRAEAPELRSIGEAIVAAARKGDFAAFQKENQRFHREIIVAAGSSVLLRVWDSLSYEISARAVIKSMPSADPVAIAREHVDIVDALEAGEFEKAAALLSAHTLHLAEHLEAEMRVALQQA